MLRGIAVALLVSLAGVVPAESTKTVETRPGAFEIRGLKGLWWEGFEKYEKALPWLAEHNMNWLMLCYTSFPESAMEWRRDYSAEQRERLRQLVTRGEDLGVSVCLSFNPGIWSKPPLCHSCEDDYQAAWRKVKHGHEAGIRWFALCLDDINRKLEPNDIEKHKTLEAAQIAFVNRMWADLQKLDPAAKLIFCPSAYTTDDMQKHMEYTRAIGEGVAPGVELFWTGPTVCSTTITEADADLVAGWFKRKPFIWDNYPVNDMFPWRPLLAPLKGRAKELPSHVSGILFNPMKQWEVNKIPLVSIANYLNDPRGYDASTMPEKVLAEYPESLRPAVSFLMEHYGDAFIGDPGYPPGIDLNGPDAPKRENITAELKAAKEAMFSSGEQGKALWEDVRETVEKETQTTGTAAAKP